VGNYACDSSLVVGDNGNLRVRAMTSCRSISLSCLVLSLCVQAQNPTSLKLLPALEKGLIVEQVITNSQAQRAGVQPGDVLLGWNRGSVYGDFQSPFDLAYIFLEQAPRGPITITAIRSGNRLQWQFGSDSWGFSARPNFFEPLLSSYRQSERWFASGKLAKATDGLRALAAVLPGDCPPWLRPWLLSHAGKTLVGAREWELADAVYQDALAQAADAGPVVRAELFRQVAFGFEVRQDLSRATENYQNVLAEAGKLGRKTMLESNTHQSLAVIALKRGDFDSAENHLLRARTIAEFLAPDGIQTILATANLAVLYQDQGRLQEAEQLYLKVLDKEEKHFPRSTHLENTLNDLGVLYDQQGDLARAKVYHRKALSVAEHLDPDSLDVADILADLAECMAEQENPAAAEIVQKRALSIREKANPGGLPSAYSLAGLGKIARLRGDLIKAQEYYSKSLTIAENVDAPAHDRAKFLIGFAAVLRQQRDFPKGEDLYRKALKIIEGKDPESIDRTTTLGDLAGILYHEGRFDEAAELYRQALNTLENRILRLGGAEDARSRYRAEHVRYYQEYMRLLIEQAQPEVAFEVLEGSRARTLFEMLEQARVDTEKGTDPAIRERARKLRRLLNAKTEYRIRLVGGAGSDQQLAVLDKEIDELLLQYQQVEYQLRSSSPAYAALTQPQKLGVSEIQSLLDANSLLLEYSLGEERSYVWAVTAKSLRAYVLPKGLEIEAAARRVYDLLTLKNRIANKQSHDHADTAERKYVEAANKLSEMVIGPVAHLLTGKRLLIVSDGALQYIPFAALPMPGNRAGSVPLIVKHEIINLPSASVLAELRRQQIGRRKASMTVAVLADPIFDPTDERLKKMPLQKASSSRRDSDVIRSAKDLDMTRGAKPYLSRLLYTRNEADAVMAVTPPGKGMLAVDFDASRAVATSPALAKYRIVHFATHGIINNRHPELSGLVLSLVNKQGKPQDGFLKLQDIYSMKLPVDLVVLSGCETGLGEQISGEGLLSLTRGFMYAGAIRVVASLWSVSDVATASLMADFYRAMERDGMRPAAALRAAQIQMWKQEQWSSPYYWAAFQIQGDWK
jgi:CHAT domain-containing protein/Tfp pilus assembly protein PilF